MSNKEATARIKINNLLATAGWRFFAEGSLPANIRLEPSVKIKSSDLDAMGENAAGNRHKYRAQEARNSQVGLIDMQR